MIYVDVLTSAWTIAGVVASFLVAFIALFLGINSNRQIKKMRTDEKRERILNKIIDWVSEVKIKTLHADIKTYNKRNYNYIFSGISDVLFKAELMKLRASKNSIPVENELDNVWQSAFYCSQLASRMAGNKPPTDEQRKSWSRNALDIVSRIDQLEAQGKLTDQEMRDGQKDLLKKISDCLKKLTEVEATL